MRRKVRPKFGGEQNATPPARTPEPIPVKTPPGHDAKFKAIFDRNGYPESRPARKALLGLPQADQPRRTARPSTTTQLASPPFRREDLPAHLELHVDLITAPYGLDNADKSALLREVSARYEARSAPPPLPRRAPERWKKRADRSETPVRFTERVYGPWIGRGLTRPTLRQLDYALYSALGVWAHRHPDQPVPHLPTLSEWIDQQVADLADRYSPDDLRKLGLALQKRQLKAS